MIVLDTHAWVWWISDPNLLSPTAREAIESSTDDGGFLISSISAWEVALLVRKGRMELTMDVSDWVRKSDQLPFVSFHHVDIDVALRSVNLPDPFHSDPADRIIVATAIETNSLLITKDTRILTYPHVRALW